MDLFGFNLLGLCSTPEMLSLKAKMSNAQKKNQITLMSLFNYYSNIAVTRYDWKNLPESVDERFLNTTLYLFGSSAFFEDEKFGFMTLPCTAGGEYNAYYNPTRVNAFSFNISKVLTQDQFVYMRANPSTVPLAAMCFELISRMSDTLRTMDVILKNLKRPFIMTCEEKQRKTYINLIKQVEDNEPLILGQSNYGLDKSRIELMPTNFDPKLDELWNTYRNYENMLFSVLGIESAGAEKRERLLVDEVNSNNMVTEISSEVALKELRAACEQINKRWNLNISVTAKSIGDYREGVETRGALYDNPKGDSE